jgi:DNA-binding response OmpR family regulator
MAKTILIVEDEWKLRELLVDYLSLEGYQILQAANGQEALRLFRETPIDHIILDIMIPFLDGLSVCRAVRAESDVMIVMLTAKSQEDDKLAGYELGADDYVTKPFSPKCWSPKLKRCLKGRKTGIPSLT